MESFPSKAMRAFDKPVVFYYAPETGSFVIDGYVNNQRAQIVAGPASTAEDHSEAIAMSSEGMSVAEIAETVTNKRRLKNQKERGLSDTMPLEQVVSEWARFSAQDNVVVSDLSLGEFIIEALPVLLPFVSKDSARNNLRAVNLALSPETTDLVSTDGHRLQVAGIDATYLPEAHDEVNYSIPVKLLSALKLHTCLEFTGTAYQCSLTCFSEEYDVITISWKNSSEKFPPWQAVIPNVDGDDMFEMQHCIPAWGKVPASCRKSDHVLHLLGNEELDQFYPFGILDPDDLIYLGETNLSPSEFGSWMALSAKYAYELGKCVTKVSPDDIKLFVYFTKGGPDRSKPIRADWVSGNIQYTHVLMPKRDQGSWENAELG